MFIYLLLHSYGSLLTLTFIWFFTYYFNHLLLYLLLQLYSSAIGMTKSPKRVVPLLLVTHQHFSSSHCLRRNLPFLVHSGAHDPSARAFSRLLSHLLFPASTLLATASNSTHTAKDVFIVMLLSSAPVCNVPSPAASEVFMENHQRHFSCNSWVWFNRIIPANITNLRYGTLHH